MSTNQGPSQAWVDEKDKCDGEVELFDRQLLNGLDLSMCPTTFNPPISIDHITTNGLPVAIHVEGDILAKKYDFMMGDLNTNPYKIAQVVRKYTGAEIVFGQNTYFLEVGPNVDVAFICMCAYAIDELFKDDN